MTDSLVADLLAYIDASPSPFHATASAAQMLQEAGYRALSEVEPWSLSPGERAFVIRGGASLVAFEVGSEPLVEAGCDLIGAHTDSPNLRLKPAPDVTAHGYRQLGVEVYGGVLLTTWLDRDLGLAGRVYWSRGDGPQRASLVNIARPIMRVPNLAIHLNRTVNTDGLKLNPQRHLPPLLGIDGPDFPSLAELLCQTLKAQGENVSPSDIHGWDLGLYDVQPATTGGLNDEFIYAARLDNLASCFAALRALTGVDAPRPRTRAIVLYDHEEVGSRSAQGANSSLLGDVLGRLTRGQTDSHDALSRAVARSLLISADMAHAVHPNYPEKHDGQHRPLLGSGPVIKTNVSQAYATDAESMARFKQLCRAADVQPQHFVSRADLACGSTIGPITAGQLGIRTVDVGNPLMSMHSIREMAGTADVAAFQAVLDALFK